MSFFKRPFQKIKDAASLHGSSDELSGSEKESRTNGHIPRSSVDGRGAASNTSHINGTSTPDTRRQSQELLHQDRVRRSMDKERRKVEEKKRLQLRKIESVAYMENGPEELTKLYRPFSMNQSKRRTGEPRLLFKELNFEGM